MKMVEAQRKSHSPDEIIAVLLFNLPTEEFRADEKAIHETIADLADQYPSLFGFFEITSDYPYRFSRPLEKVLHRLGQSRLLGIWNPDFVRYRIDSESKATIEKRILPAFDEKERKILKEAAAKLAEVTKVEG